MEDYKKFFRYVIPGLVFMIEVFVYLLLSAFDRVKDIIKTYCLCVDTGIPISGLLIAIGIGYIFGVIYHYLFHLVRNWRCSDSLITNHLSLIKAAVNKNWLTLEKCKENHETIETEKLTQSGAWRVVTVFLNTRMESSERIRAAKPRLENYGDIMHGAGTTFVSSVLAIPAWLFLHYKLSNNFPYLCIFIVPIIISFLHIWNFKNIAKDYQGVSNIIIANELQKESKDGQEPVIMYIAEDDVKLFRNI